MESEGKVLVVKRIKVRYHLRAEWLHKDTIERVHSFHERGCPITRSIGGCIAISTELDLTLE